MIADSWISTFSMSKPRDLTVAGSTKGGHKAGDISKEDVVGE